MDQAVQVWREARAGRIRLNRPAALNALNLSMVQAMREALQNFAEDPAVHLVLVDVPVRGFCAGGDVRGMRDAALAGDQAAVEGFFAAEYALNQAIAAFAKPYVALVDGLCLGGGIGISAHGSHRIATERAAFAMPETAIALFPDVGMSYFLPRLPGALGMYLGLTGARMNGADAVHAGFATHFVSADRLEALAAAIVRDGVAVIAGFAEPLPAFSLAGERPLIDDAFAAASVPEILQRLQLPEDAFAAATLAQLQAHSPRAIHWSYEILRRGAQQTLPACLAAELALVRQIALHPEFFEGVRAMLVDKDRTPRWQPARLDAVDREEITALFAGMPPAAAPAAP